MVELQDDLLDIYNNLVTFSKDTLNTKFPTPIVVWYDKDARQVVFEQKSKTVRLNVLTYYCLDLEGIQKRTYLLPVDYDYLMSTLKDLINSGVLRNDRVCLSPENYGFDIFGVDRNEFWKGPGILGKIRFVSGKSWLFKKIVKHRFKL